MSTDLKKTLIRQFVHRLNHPENGTYDLETWYLFSILQGQFSVEIEKSGIGKHFRLGKSDFSLANKEDVIMFFNTLYNFC